MKIIITVLSLSILTVTSGCSFVKGTDYIYREDVNVVATEGCFSVPAHFHRSASIKNCQTVTVRNESGVEQTLYGIASFVRKGGDGFIQCNIRKECIGAIYQEEYQRDTPPHRTHLIPFPR